MAARKNGGAIEHLIYGWGWLDEGEGRRYGGGRRWVFKSFVSAW
jgi:hypothetical protein